MRSAAGAGAGERIPRLAPDWDPGDSRLSPAEGFLLSRIDGRTPWSQLRQIGGLPPDEVDRCLERWVGQGMLEVAGAAGATPAAAGPQDSDSPEGKIADGLDPQLDLPEQTQRRILDFEAGLERPYHALLGVPRDADGREIKRAYFRLSKEFHPDRYFGRQIGAFAARLERIFKRLVEACELLSDPATRAEVERSYAQMSPPPPEASAPAAEARRSSKRDALERLRRQFRIPEEILGQRRIKARQFSEAARVAVHRESWLEAAASARLAIAFDPWNDDHRRSFAEIQARVHEVRAAELLEEAAASWDSHAQKEALRLYEEALSFRPYDPEVNARAAQLCLELDRLDEALEYAGIACEGAPECADHHVLLGRVLRRQGVRGRARQALDRALELDRDNADAKKELMTLRRSRRRPGGGTG